MAPTPASTAEPGAYSAASSLARAAAATVLRLLPRRLSTLTSHDAAEGTSPHRRATANANTVPQSYGLPNSPPPGTVAGIVVGSVAAFLFCLWVLYFCINFRSWSSSNDRGSVTDFTATSVVSSRRRSRTRVIGVRRRSPSRSRSRSRSRVTSGTVMTSAGPAAAAAAVLAVEGARRNRSRSRSRGGAGRFMRVKKTRRTKTTSGPETVEVRKTDRRSGGARGARGSGARYDYHNPNEDQIIVEEEMTDRSALGRGYEASSIRSRSRSRGPPAPPSLLSTPPRGVSGGARHAGPPPRSRNAPGGRPPRVVPSSVMSSEDYSHSESGSEDDEIVVMEENSTPPRSRRDSGRRDRR